MALIQESPYSLELLKLSLLVVTFLTLNCVLSVTIKWSLGVSGFNFPLVLTASHMAFAFFALLPWMLVKEKSRSQHFACLRGSWKGLLAIGVCQAGNIALNNSSLVMITLTLNQIIRG